MDSQILMAENELDTNYFPKTCLSLITVHFCAQAVICSKNVLSKNNF